MSFVDSIEIMAVRIRNPNSNTIKCRSIWIFFLVYYFFYNHPKNLYVNIVLVCILREIVKKGREGVVGFE